VSVVNISHSGAAVHVGDTVQYTVVTTNDGASDALSSVVRDTLPAGVDYVAGSLTIAGTNAGTKTDVGGDDQSEYAASSKLITARLGAGATAATGGTIAAGQSETLVFRAVATAAGTLVDSTSGSYVDGFSNYPKTTDAATASTVVSIAPTSDLGVSEVPTVNTPVAGDTTTNPAWTVIVANVGPQDDSGVVATVTVPSQLAAASVTLNGTSYPVVGGVATVPVGALAVGASATITVTGTLDAATPAGTVLTNAVTVTGDNAEVNPVNNAISSSVTTAAVSDLSTTTVATALNVTVGSPATFTIGVTGTGPSTATDVKVLLTVPAGLTVTPSVGTFDATTNIWTVPAVAAGSNQTVTLSGTTTVVGKLKAVAQVQSSSVPDANYANNRSTATITVQKGVQLPTLPVSDPTPTTPAAVTPTAIDDTAVKSSTLAYTGAENTDGSLLLGFLLMLGGLVMVGGRFVVAGVRRRR
jgi:uncharacterized repeat protein (TIGR01451 family)